MIVRIHSTKIDHFGTRLCDELGRKLHLNAFNHSESHLFLKSPMKTLFIRDYALQVGCIVWSLLGGTSFFVEDEHGEYQTTDEDFREMRGVTEKPLSFSRIFSTDSTETNASCSVMLSRFDRFQIGELSKTAAALNAQEIIKPFHGASWQVNGHDANVSNSLLRIRAHAFSFSAERDEGFVHMHTQLVDMPDHVVI